MLPKVVVNFFFVKLNKLYKILAFAIQRHHEKVQLAIRENKLAKMFQSKAYEKREEEYCESKYVRDENGTLKMKEEKVMERWKSYFSSLLNKTNKYQLEEEDKVKGPIWGVTEHIVEQLLKIMKVGKALRPYGVTSDLIIIKAAGAT